MPQNEQSDDTPAPRQAASAAEPAISDDCRAARIEEVTQFAECRMTTSASCPYRMTFNAYLYCVHPQREAIIARTLAEEEARGK
jgi:hypothetical protein